MRGAGGRVYTVTELQGEVKELLEAHSQGLWVQGEISNLRIYRSGHAYFTLKDEGAQLAAVCWRSYVARLRFAPEDGMAVRARGYLTVYAPRGEYQLVAQGLEPVGAGPLQVAFEQLRKRLEEEGLFDPARKKPLPRWPRRVALVTSPSGAAVRDLIHVASRRWPALELVVVPVKVQGEGAAAEIADGVRLADGLGFDVLVVGRGGGSLEDLWAFNEEPVARAIAAARTPVVSAVGHEVDVTIADLVADLRAATPSAAAETVAPDRAEALQALAAQRRRLDRALRRRVEDLRRALDHLRSSRPFRRPLEFVRETERRLDERAERLPAALRAALRDRRRGLEALAGRLDALSPLKVLARGYSMTLKDGRVLTRAADVQPGDSLRTVLAEGEVRSSVVGAPGGPVPGAERGGAP